MRLIDEPPGAPNCTVTAAAGLACPRAAEALDDVLRALCSGAGGERVVGELHAARSGGGA